MLNSNKELWAISPVDGRYASATSDLTAYFSEAALIKYRLKVEVEYLIALNDWKIGALASVDAQKVNIITHDMNAKVK